MAMFSGFVRSHGQCGLVAVLMLGLFHSLVPATEAASPESMAVGQQLFERNWSARSPQLGSDGLGPVFNAESCVACHRQGGIGGAGDSRFNAQALGIESMHFTAKRTGMAEVGVVLDRFYPGFVQPDGSLISSVPIPHHSTGPSFNMLREKLLQAAQYRGTAEGGLPSVDALRLATENTISYTDKVGDNEITVKFRLFQRNTPSLFGSGLIDQIEDEVILKLAKLQQRHPEISGRASILRDGTIGRFGWRGNANRLIHFIDRACANELGLETERRRQGVDPTRPQYRNPAVDISDQQIEQMSAFVAALPSPVREIPSSPIARELATHGAGLFQSMGCSVCHVPELAPARGIYSDLLLHDMGSQLYDFDAAEPSIVRTKLIKEVRVVPESVEFTHYYGHPVKLGAMRIFDRCDCVTERGTLVERDYVTVAAIGQGRGFDRSPNNLTFSRVRGRFREELGVERHLEPSNTTQEWRTPPLWGLADSAPYMHDGRAETVLEAIAMHGGESAGTRDRFLQLSLPEQRAILAFLGTLIAPANVPQPAH